MMMMTTMRQLTTVAGCYVIAAAILLPVVCCLATDATKDADDAREKNARPTASQASLPSAIFENSSPNSYANRASVPGLPTSSFSPGSGSTPPETNSFRDIAAGFSSSKAYADEFDKTQSKVTNENNLSRDSITSSRNDTPASIDVIWTTASHAEEVKKVATETDEQLVHSPEDGGSNSRSRPKVTSGSETGSRTTDYFLSVLGGGGCCSTSTEVRKTTTTDRYDDNDYNDDDDDVNDEKNGDSDAERRDDAYGYSDRGDDSQTYEDYRGGGGVMDGEDEDGDGGEGGGGGGGGSDESRTEYLYVSDNFTTNDSQADPENQDLQQDSNSDYSDDYNNPSIDLQSRDQPADHGQRFRASVDYEAEGRDYHLGVEQHNFHLNLGEKLSEMRGGVHRGQLISLRWLEHHPINHFAVFLWLVVALALVSILMLAYRFRHSVINAIQCTRANYKQGKRFGVEEANDLLSNAQV